MSIEKCQYLVGHTNVPIRKGNLIGLANVSIEKVSIPHWSCKCANRDDNPVVGHINVLISFIAMVMQMFPLRVVNT